MPDTPDTYTCAGCGGTFDKGWSDEEADAESVATFGVRGDAPGMATVCDPCYQQIMRVAPRDAYHRHLDACAQCRNHPFNQCAVGARLLREAVDAAD
jgi:hypothetical protein